MKFQVLTSIFLVVTFFACQAQPGKMSRPNIIFIMADDHATRAISAYGDSINLTPNIDRIANEGALFVNSFCANSICSPSRATILTGKHSHKNGVTGNGALWKSNQTLLPRQLKRNGYATALFGKWHLNRNPGNEFDQWKILMGAGRQGHYYNPEFTDKTGKSIVEEGYSTDIITRESLEWMDAHQAKKEDKPFFLMVQYKAPHTPRMPALRHLHVYEQDTIPEPLTLFDDYSTRGKHAGKAAMKIKSEPGMSLNVFPAYNSYDINKKQYHYLQRMNEEQRQAYHAYYDSLNNEYRQMKRAGLLEGRAGKSYSYQRFIKDYLRVVKGIDENVGTILKYLDDHDLSENTIVVYASDQSYFTGEHGWAEKRYMYEEAMKMPLLMRWPARISEGTVVEELVQNIDYLPTFLDMAGVKVPDDVQGTSFKSLAFGKLPPQWREAVYYHYYDHGRHNVPRHEGIRTARFKLIWFYTTDTWELYDLYKDPHEVNNIYGNSECQDVEMMLKEQLQQLRKRYEVPDSLFHPPYMPVGRGRH